MRLIDADKLQEHLEKVKKESANLVDMSHIIGFQSVVVAQPTAFDFEKVIGQYKWERDIAMYQLEQLGIGFGQKLEDEVIEKVKEVIRCV